LRVQPIRVGKLRAAASATHHVTGAWPKESVATEDSGTREG
jgi:hypothetical protein